MGVKFQTDLDSKYLSRFQALAGALKERAFLTGNKILIEQIKMDELKTQGGLYIPTKEDGAGFAKSRTAQGLTHVGLVLLTGEDNALPSGKPVEPGSIVWVSEFGVRPCTNFPGLLEMTEETLQLTDTSNINMIFNSLDAYREAVQVLNGEER